jgi:oxygen-dependent protoporphyrinogen oxidase
MEPDDITLARVAHDDLASLLGIAAPPLFVRITRHRRVLPQYEVGHLDRVAAIEARLPRHPGLGLVGSAYRGVGIRDTIRSAEETADRLFAASAAT